MLIRTSTGNFDTSRGVGRQPCGRCFSLLHPGSGFSSVTKPPHVAPHLGVCLVSPVVPRAFAEAFSRPGMADVHLHPNPWKQPPVDVLKVGMAAAISYLDDLKHYGSTSSNRLKVVLVGLANAGKTSIATRLDSPAACLPTTEERTVGVEIRDIELGPGPPNPPGEARTDDELDVKLWDFAGQRAYYETHQVGRVIITIRILTYRHW